MRGFLILLCTLYLVGASSEKVYICTGPQSKCYHKTDNCQGLRNCSKEIKQITLKDAKEMGRRPCSFCYGK